MTRVLKSPVAFFDTTPIGMSTRRYMVFFSSALGRIISRLSKDQDTLDSELSMTLNQVRLPYNHRFIPLDDYLLVFEHVQLSYRYDWAGVLHLPLPRHHLCAHDCDILLHPELLPQDFGRDEASGFHHAICVV